jgi:heme oxygenase
MTHAALERTPLMLALAADSLSIPAYCRYLLLQWRLHAPFEASIWRWLPPDWAALRLRKSEWLCQDLQSIGARPVESFTPAGGIDSWAQAMGVLYVLEGSTLGLQVVRKQLQDKHPALQHAGRFMLGYGPDTGRHWRAFLAQFESLAEAEWPLAEEAASATFDHFLEEFSSVEVQAVEDAAPA